ncbi:hypothetical protein BDV98DRAFT_585340 [Pterulicium gracile]|uniref:Uncharacterized protein n=1 Tax=Pterulicium gracile TaxID=1884261 RepID=A0A5C3Q7Q1_9AGAR|nr:hypothetical protein BDV98DRAFT_585340 [Pterula gracilis]
MSLEDSTFATPSFLITNLERVVSRCVELTSSSQYTVVPSLQYLAQVVEIFIRWAHIHPLTGNNRKGLRSISETVTEIALVLEDTRFEEHRNDNEVNVALANIVKRLNTLYDECRFDSSGLQKVPLEGDFARCLQSIESSCFQIREVYSPIKPDGNLSFLLDKGKFSGKQGLWTGNTGAGLADLRHANGELILYPCNASTRNLIQAETLVVTEGKLFTDNKFAKGEKSWHRTKAWGARINAVQGAFNNNKGKIGTISIVDAEFTTEGEAFCNNANESHRWPWGSSSGKI